MRKTLYFIFLPLRLNWRHFTRMQCKNDKITIKPVVENATGMFCMIQSLALKVILWSGVKVCIERMCRTYLNSVKAIRPVRTWL